MPIRTCLLAVLLLGLSACVPQPKWGTTRPLTAADLHSSADTRHVVDRNYILGVEQSAFVGQPLVRVKDYTVESSTSDATFKSPVEITANWMFGQKADFPAGTDLRIIGTVDYEGSHVFLAALPHPTYQQFPLLVTPEGQYLNRAMAKNGMIYAPIDPTGVNYSPTVIQFTRTPNEHISKTAGYINFEIVYSGATKDAINLLYREYTPEDMARPAFTQNLTYDRAAKTLRFRDIQMSVASTDSERITYTVQADGLSKE